MAIGGDKTRIIVTVDKELKNNLEKLAQKDNRNLSNYLNNVLIKHWEDNKKE
ncbi:MULTISPECIES: toxin-antitoxin system protein [Clostridium]|uniref:toxin-antitoxin system protein n=1 Tax=Clostridium TaxID=1485 RepID=UPI0019D4AF6D|nr:MULTISPECIES: toxin-antitoxin system protein [Clostridium]